MDTIFGSYEVVFWRLEHIDPPNMDKFLVFQR